MLIEPKGQRDVTLIATGSEVALAVDAAKALGGEGIAAAVVSMPCWELFEAQDGPIRTPFWARAPRVGVEAAVEFGWRKWLGSYGKFVGMHGFGASAPAEELYKHFGITVAAIKAAAVDVIGKSQ